MFIRILKQKGYALLTVVWLVLITIVSSIPNLHVKSVAAIPELDKLVHIVIFAILAYLFSGSIGKYVKSGKVMGQILVVLVLTILFGYLDELHQSTVVGRTYSLLDLLADGIGALIGVLVYSRFHLNSDHDKPIPVKK